MPPFLQIGLIAILYNLNITGDAPWTQTLDHFEEFASSEILKAMYRWITDYLE